MTIDTAAPNMPPPISENPEQGLSDPDLAKYAELISEIELTDEQATELLSVIWSMMRTFVEIGFDVKLCGQFLENQVDEEIADSDGVESDQSSNSGVGRPGGSDERRP